MFKRWMLGLAAAVAVLGATAVAAAAEEDDALVGEPVITEDHRTPPGYYLWRGDRGMHLRTHGTEEGKTYTAYLFTDGQFVDVEKVKLEPGDRVAVTNGGHTLIVHVRTFEGIDGVNFKVRGGDILALTLFEDGRLAPTSHIFLGRHHRHPATNPFVLTP
jgi:hypothetical protein